eukprot:2570751-Prymnesium_polylepis.1
MDVVGGGDLERMRCLLNELAPPVCPRAGNLFWTTDSTPHESLPLRKRCYRQFFRLVTSEVGVWWAKHSTPNPLGVEPPGGTLILTRDKFTGEETCDDAKEEGADRVQCEGLGTIGRLQTGAKLAVSAARCGPERIACTLSAPGESGSRERVARSALRASVSG